MKAWLRMHLFIYSFITRYWYDMIMDGRTRYWLRMRICVLCFWVRGWFSVIVNVM